MTYMDDLESMILEPVDHSPSSKYLYVKLVSIRQYIGFLSTQWQKYTIAAKSPFFNFARSVTVANTPK